MIIHEDKICLIRRGKPPAMGMWTFPGGALELGESLELSLKREVREEVGLEVEVGHLEAVIEFVDRDPSGRVRFHYVILDYIAWPVGGSLQPGSDVSHACWAGLEELGELDMTSKAQEMARDLLSRQESYDR
jgi:ADP-ribose pyrophosphatase YjhB (NUDIX family)